MMKLREVNGLESVGHGLRQAIITVRVTADERGKSLSLADDRRGIMLMIPVEPVEDLLDVKTE